MHYLRLLLVLFLAMSGLQVWAQNYPVRPVRIIVPLAPGGGVDLVARGIAAGLTEGFKQPVVVDNRPGATGTIGMTLTARAAPDGHTLLVVSASFVVIPLLTPGVYDPVGDFSPVTVFSTQPLMLVVNASVPAKSVTEFVALARAKPGTLNFGSSGAGGFLHLAGELLGAMTGTKLVHVPYKGATAALPDLLGGQIQFMFVSPAVALPAIKSGRLRGLGVGGRTRFKSAPEYAPLHEAGVPGYEATQWIGMLAPAKTPKLIIDLLQRASVVALQRPEFLTQLSADGSEPVGSTPEQFAQNIKVELEKWRKVIKEAGIKVE